MAITYLSLRPNDTFLWQQTEQHPPLRRAALKLACIVAVPLELIARCFYNIGVWIYNALYPKTIQPVVIPRSQPPLSPEVNEVIEQAIVPVQEISFQIRGVVYGQAIGDGLGLFTEFLTRQQAQQLKREGLAFAHRPVFEAVNPHVKNFPVNGWTDDTDQALMIVNVEKENLLDPSKPKEVRMAQHLCNWYQHGLNGFSTIEGFAFKTREDPDSIDPNRKQIGCRGLGALTRDVILKKTFKEDPHVAAKEVWAHNNLPLRARPAANGAVMRTGVIGAMYHTDLKQAVQEAIRYAKVTHADPRSIASAVAVTAAIALLLSGADVEKAIDSAEEIAVCVLKDEMQKIYNDVTAADQENWKNINLEFEKELRACMHAELRELDLDEPRKIGYTFKTLGAGFYALRRAALLGQDEIHGQGNVFQTVIKEIIWEGGDADTNAAVAGALVGALRERDEINDRFDLNDKDFQILIDAVVHCKQVAKRVLGKP